MMPSPDDLSFASATKLAELIATSEVSSTEVLDHLLARVERLDGDINSVVTIDAEQAHVRATQADEAVVAAKSGGPALGPLHGVPMTVKDSYSTAGMRTTSGAPELSDYVPTEDAWAVTAMRDAGAIPFGKTNLPIWAGDLQSFNEVFGTTNNPWDVSRTPGGSSGGAGAALAAGFTPIELGSDIGGSIRLPSHMCGVMGHKPSYQIAPGHGHIPSQPGMFTMSDLAVYGPMARSVDDLELQLDLMVGPDRWDTPGWSLNLPPARTTDVKSLRVATWFDDERCPVDPDVRVLLEGAANALAGAGARVDDTARPGFTLEKVASTFSQLLMAALSGGFDRARIERFASDESDTPHGRDRRATAMRHRDWLSLHERRLQMRKSFEDFFTDWDVLLLPVMARTAFPHDQSFPQAVRMAEVAGKEVPYMDLTTWMAPAGCCYLPATVVPVGVASDGLPVGIQIVGPYLHDATTLAVARMLTEVIEPIGPPPGFE